MDIKANIGSRLRKARLEKGLSQKDLAEKLGLSANSVISDFERNKLYPRLETLLKMADVLDVDLHWLITGDHSPSVAEIYNLLSPFIWTYINNRTEDVNNLRSKKKELENINSPEDIGRIEDIEDHITSQNGVITAVVKHLEFIQKKYNL